MSTSEKPGRKATDRIAVTDGGAASRELASLAALKGMKVVFLCDGDVRPAQEHIRRSLDEKVGRWTISPSEAKALFSRIEFLPALEPVEVGLVVDFRSSVEADAAAWCAKLDSTFPARTVIAVEMGAEPFASLTGGGTRFAGLRFFPPVWEVETVEVLSNGIAPSAREVVLAFVERLGKKVVRVGNVPGTVTLRPFVALLTACFEVAASGAAELDEVNDAVKSALRMKAGPVEIARIIGFETVKRWCEAFEEDPAVRAFIDNLRD